MLIPAEFVTMTVFRLAVPTVANVEEIAAEAGPYWIRRPPQEKPLREGHLISCDSLALSEPRNRRVSPSVRQNQPLPPAAYLQDARNR